MKELLEPSLYPPVYRGTDADIPMPDSAIIVRCPECGQAKNGKKPTMLFRARMTAGTVIEVKCKRCKALYRFRAEAEGA